MRSLWTVKGTFSDLWNIIERMRVMIETETNCAGKYNSSPQGNTAGNVHFCQCFGYCQCPLGYINEICNANTFNSKESLNFVFLFTQLCKNGHSLFFSLGLQFYLYTPHPHTHTIFRLVNWSQLFFFQTFHVAMIQNLVSYLFSHYYSQYCYQYYG